MLSYKEYLKDKNKKDIIAMIHVPALPGTPKNSMSSEEILSKAIAEAKTYLELGLKTVMIENMHDVPYTKSIGPEITGMMAVIGNKIKELGLYCGIQILGGGNNEALAAAKAAGLDFIRAEGYVFCHVGDEGFYNSCAGELLRYRKMIGAEEIMVFTDIKKKHSSHAITSDVSVEETTHAAEFFLSDGIIVTGRTTGDAVNIADLKEIQNIKILRIIGSGITSENIKKYFKLADLFIVGSSLKKDGYWENEIDKARVKKLMDELKKLGNAK
ncbi:BtpA/SgcQ family protein [Candidatus Woesearchaeota archaeon]|nr:BtpA/SgcQ family protein [Candidatus Woesearchaeota archaeon]